MMLRLMALAAMSMSAGLAWNALAEGPTTRPVAKRPVTAVPQQGAIAGFAFGNLGQGPTTRPVALIMPELLQGPRTRPIAR